MRSLNAPAVHLLSLYGVDKFYHFLRKQACNCSANPTNTGCLSSWQLREQLWELSASTVLREPSAALGHLRPQRSQPEQTQPLISIGAAYLVLDILKDVRSTGTGKPVAGVRLQAFPSPEDRYKLRQPRCMGSRRYAPVDHSRLGGELLEAAFQA